MGKERIEVVDLLRGLSCLGVLLYHVRVDLWTGWWNIKFHPQNYSSFEKCTAWLSIPTPFMGYAILLFFLGVAPAVFDFLALQLGIGYPPTLALSLGIILLTIKILLMDIERSRLEIRIQRLTQRVAIFEAEYKDQNANTDTQGPGSPKEDEADKPPPLRAS